MMRSALVVRRVVRLVVRLALGLAVTLALGLAVTLAVTLALGLSSFQPALARPAHRDGAAAQVEALEALCRDGARHWKGACAGREVNGLCLPRSAQVGADGLARKRLQRSAARARQAMAAFDQVLKTWQGGRMVSAIPEGHPDREGLLARVMVCVSAAHFSLLEKEFEAYLDLGLPPPLDLRPGDPERERAMMRTFKGWLQDRLKAGELLVKRYADIVREVRLPLGPGKWLSGDTRVEVAAMVRAGQTYHDLYQALMSIPPPPAVMDAQAQAAFREQLLVVSEPMRTKAKMHYELAIQRCGRLGLPATEPWLLLARRAVAALGSSSPSPKAPPGRP
ncbi:MAG: hypothetical protein RBU30_21135 [Polyangia bacterium]|nr:hypothetical protein [Polyangia bacterium]